MSLIRNACSYLGLELCSRPVENILTILVSDFAVSVMVPPAVDDLCSNHVVGVCTLASQIKLTNLYQDS